MTRHSPLLAGVALLALLGFGVRHSAAQSSSVQSITIQTGWGGLGRPQHASVTIERRDGAFWRNHEAVDAALIDALLRALNAPVIAKPQMANLGITPAWLAAQWPDARKSMPMVGDGQDPLPAQVRFYEESFESPAAIAPAFADCFRFTKSDDNPWASVRVAFANGTQLTAKSASYYGFMVPWTLGATRTYNADISRAVAALLPLGTPEKQRLMGEGFVEDLSRSLSILVEDRWNLLGAEGRTGSALQRLRQRYTVLSVDINYYHDVYFGRPWDAPGPHETNLHVLAHKQGTPAFLREQWVLGFHKGQVEGLSEALAQAPQYENLALSVPWLQAWLQRHPEQTITVALVHGVSFGDHALKSFAADMKARGRPDLIASVRARQQQIALLHVGFAYWLLFPDHHMLLWRFEGPRGFLKWKESDFPAGDCDSEYAPSDGGCSGRQVSPEGQLLPDAPPRDRICLAAWRKTHAVPNPLPKALFTIDENGRDGMIDAQGRVVIPTCFDAVVDYSEGLARFERDNSWGYVDATGQVVVPPKFPWAEPFHDGVAWVQVTGEALDDDAQWGVLDSMGHVVSAPPGMQVLSGPDRFQEGLATVQVVSKSGNLSSGFIDRSGRMAIPPRFGEAFAFSEGAAAVQASPAASALWGFIDKAGNWLIPPKYEFASEFAEGLAAVTLHGACVYIDHSGAVVLKPPMPSQPPMAGKPFLPSRALDCAEISGPFSEGLSSWRFGRHYGFIDRTGRTVIPPKFDLAYEFSEGLAAVQIDHRWGYVDRHGKTVIPVQDFTTVESFHNGLARVTKKSGVGYIDRRGKLVWFGPRD